MSDDSMTTQQGRGQEPAGTVRIVLLAIVFFGLMVLSIHEIIALWPTIILNSVEEGNRSLSIAQWQTSYVDGLYLNVLPTSEQRALWLIVFSGVVGSCVHVLTSLAPFVGNRRFLRSWTLWYLARPLIGAGLAFLIVAVLWGGLSTPMQGFNGSNPYQLVAISGLAGMFSRTASDKLEEFFDQLFKSDKNDIREDK
ncbi:MAG: hypothetical protein FGM24_11510 [Candidatus Kapabacteria bacterium]|nr:hypothetical protein [Candidatus Kapabacteria bacterium]